MKLTKLIIIAIVLLAIEPCSAQKLADKVYFDNNWNIIPNASNASYYRLYNAKDKSKGLKPYQDYYINGKLQGEGFYSRIETVDGTINFIEEGEQKNYYESGKLREKWTKKNDKIDGEDYHYSEEGYKTYVLNYQNGILQGNQFMYQLESDKIHKVDMFENGYLQSETTYYNDGTVREEFKLTQIYDSAFSANVTEHYLEYYIHNKTATSSTDYLYLFMPEVLTHVFYLYRLPQDYIIPHGKMVNTDREGRNIYIGQYRYGEQTGLWREYFFDEGYYVSDNFDTDELRYYTLDNKPYTGKHTSYFPNDKVCETGSCKNGLRDGFWKAFYNNGLRVDALRSEINFKDGKQEGTFKYYNTEGKILMDGARANGNLVGQLRQYYYEDNCYEVLDYSNLSEPSRFSSLDDKPFSGLHTERRNIDGINEPVTVTYTISQSLITRHTIKGDNTGTIYQTTEYKNGNPIK